MGSGVDHPSWRQIPGSTRDVNGIVANLPGNKADFQWVLYGEGIALGNGGVFGTAELPNGAQRQLDVATGAGGTWVLGPADSHGNAPLFRAIGILKDKEGANPDTKPLEQCKDGIAGNRIAAAARSSLWILSRGGRIDELEAPSFQQMHDHCGTLAPRSGCAHAIAVGDDNRPWVLGCEARPDGNRPVFHYNGDRFDEVDGWGISIAVDPTTNLPWVVTREGALYRYKGK